MIKCFSSPTYNFVFDMNSGFFVRWGKDKDDDPLFSPAGPEILDVEISTICSRGCEWCYKSNGYKGINMSFDTFKKIFDILPTHLTQIAFGIGDIDGNPDLWKIMKYCRDNKVIPNITINGERMTSELYDKLKICGAVAVSMYDKDVCYNAVKELTDRGIQTNIHALLAEETYELCLEILDDKMVDSRLAKLNAVVFLWLKPKGKRNKFHQLTSREKFKTLVDKAFGVGKFGFDSCSAPMFLEIVKEKSPLYSQMVESCESGLFSLYINAEGKMYPCSFAEGIEKGIDILEYKHFKDVWNHPQLVSFRSRNLASVDCNGCRNCLIYDLKVKDTDGNKKI